MAGFDLDGARKAGYDDAEIASFLAPQVGFDFEGAQRAGYSPTEIVDGLTSSPKFTDYLKSAASGALSGAGMIAQGGGELLARGVNAVAPQAELRSVNPFQGAIDWLETSKSPAAHIAEAGTQITGSLFDSPDTWSFGTNPTLAGLSLQGINAIGQFGPNLLIALGTAGASIPAQLTIGAVTGGLQALGGGAEEERNKFAQMGPDELQASSALYRTLIERGVDHETAKGAVAEAAAIGGGLGNAIPSAGEGAFENFLIGALTRGKVRIPGKGLIGKAAVGATGGAALGGTEEAIEQVGQNIGSNLAIGGNRPLTADTLQQFVMGAIAEGAAGAGGGAISHVTAPAVTATAPAAVVNPAAQVVNPTAAVDKTNTRYRDYINALDQAPNADAAVAAAAAAVDAPLAPNEKIAAFVQAEQDAAARKQTEEDAAYAQREERIASLNRQIEMLGRREAEQIAEGKAEAEIAATESAQANARDEVRGLVARNVGGAPETAMSIALARAAGSNPPGYVSQDELTRRMEEWNRRQNAGTVRGNQAVIPEGGQGPEGGGALGGNDLQRAPVAGINPNGPELRAAGGTGQPQPALTDEEIARRMTASIPENFTPAAPFVAPPAPVTIMGATPDKLTTPELRISAEAAAKPEQRAAAKTELDRRAQAYQRRGELLPENDSMFTAIAKLGGMSKQDVVSSWGVDPADVKGLNPIFGKPLLRTNGGLSIDGMSELLVQHGYLDQRDLQEFERKFDQELRGKPVLTPQGMERQAAATSEATAVQQALDERAASLDLTPQELASVGYDKLHAVEQEQYQTIIDNLVESAQGKPYEALIDAIIERAIAQTEGRPFKEYAQAVIAQVKEVINAQSTNNEPAQTVSGAAVPGAQENHPATGEEGRAPAAEPVRQVAGAELALTGQTAAEVKAAESPQALAQREERERKAIADREREHFTLTPQAPAERVAAPSQQGGLFTPTGKPAEAAKTQELSAAEQKIIDEIEHTTVKRYGAPDLLNPKVKTLIAMMGDAGIGTEGSGDLYGKNLVYVDLSNAKDAEGKRLPQGWVLTWPDIHSTERDVLGTPVPRNQKDVVENVERSFPKARLAKAGNFTIDRSEAQALIDALKGTEQPAASERPYRDTATKALQKLARDTEDDAVLKAVEDELNTRAEEHAKAREERLAKGREAKATPQVIDFETFASQRDAGFNYGEPGLHKLNSSVSGAARKSAIEHSNERDRVLETKRTALRKEYDALVKSGKIRAPTSEEALQSKAAGHPDNEATQAAQRVIEKRAQRMETPGLKQAADEAEAALKAVKPAAEMSAAEHLRAAADKLEQPVEQPVEQPKEKAAPAKPAVQLDLTGKPSDNTDVGENLWYNRRNFTGKALKWDDVKALNDTLKVKEVVKSKVWPRPDYEQLVADGMQPFFARMLKKVYDGISVEPNGKADADLERYIAVVDRIRESVFDWAKDNNANVDFMNAVVNRAKPYAQRGPVSVLDMMKTESKHDMRSVILDRVWPRSKADRMFFRNEGGPEIRVIGGNRALQALQFTLDDAVQAMKDIEKGWPASQEAWQRQGYRIAPSSQAVVNEGASYDKEHKSTPLWSVATAEGWNGMTIGESYESKAEADAAKEALKPFMLLDKRGRLVSQHDTEDQAKEAARETTKRENKGGELRGMNIGQAEREGPARRADEDVSAQRLMDTFGFRGVNFGREGWINQAERQAYLNHAYDGLHDLAEIIGVPPKALSLNGMLGIAFGAQGRGGQHAAHFVPGVNEINLTKTMGAGTLSHEWGHALDHYFGSLAGLGKNAEPFLSEHVFNVDAEGYTKRTGKKEKAFESVRPEMVAAFKTIVDTMEKRPMTQEEVEKREVSYQSSVKNTLESWLKHFRQDVDRGVKGNPSTNAVKEFEQLADRLRRGDMGEGYMKVGQMQLPQVIAQIRLLIKDLHGHSTDIPSNWKGLTNAASSVRYTLTKREAAASHTPQDTTTTTYKRESNAQDAGKKGKRYWSTTLEMFARAFETYVADKLADAGQKNTFLSDAALRAEQKTPEGAFASPYPRGEERKTINAAMGKLVEAIKTQETEKGIALEQTKSEYNSAQADHIYDDAQTRPATTLEQRRLGIAAVKALFGTDRRAGATILGSALWRDFVEHKGVELVGQKAESAEDLATLAQVLRDPRFETFRLFFTKGETIVGHTGMTSRLPGVVAVYIGKPGESVEDSVARRISEFHKLKDDVGADGYWMLHNHPSGSSRPSSNDEDITRTLSSTMVGFKGHIVIDHDEFSVINERGQSTRHGIKSGPKHEPEEPHDLLGRGIHSPGTLSMIGRELQAKAGYDVMISTDYQGNVSGIAEIPTHLLLQGARSIVRARKFARGTTGARVFVVSQNPSRLENLISSGAIDDATDFAGHKSLQTLGIWATGKDQEKVAYKPRLMTAEQSKAPYIAGSQITGDFRDNYARGASDWVRNLLHSDARVGWWAKSVGTQQHKALTLPEFRPVYDEGQAFLSDISKYANGSADLAIDLLPRIEGFKDFFKKTPHKADIEKVTDALYAGTLFGGGSPLDGRVWTDAELRQGRAVDRNGVSMQAFKPMNDNQVGLYREALAATSKSLDELGKSLVHRIVRQHEIGFDREMILADVVADVQQKLDTAIEDATLAEDAAAVAQLKETKKQVKDISDKTEGLKTHGYFPAMRFGKYAVHVVDPTTEKQLYFGLFDSQTKANIAAGELKKQYPEAAIHRAIMSQEQHRLFQGLSIDALETFADYITGANGEPISKDTLVQGFLKAAMAERSVLKRHIHRKGIAGYSEDMPRVLASFTTAAARHTAMNYHGAEMGKLAQDIKSGDVKDEAIKLVRYLQDPQEEAQGIRGFLFMQFLGGSIANGLVNMTQPFMVTGPYLTQTTSASDAAIQLMKAAAVKPEKLTGAEAQAYQRAHREGVVSPQEIHQLRAQTGGLPLAKNLALRKLSYLWGSIYSLTEQFNRTTTFIAAYRIAEKKGLDNPYAFAKKAVEETQFVYNKGNRPNWARGPVGATVFTFKQFSISYLELAKRLYDKDKKAFALMALMLLAAAGIEGLPFAEDIEDMVDTMGQWMGYATNSKKKVRQWALSILGPDMAQIALRGVSGLPWMPVDVSARMGMSNLMPGTAMLKQSEKNKARDVIELAGPIGQFIPTEDTMLGRALERLGKGDIMGAVKAGAPRAIQAAAKGAEQLQTGQARDVKGKKITAVSPGEAVLQMAGLNPAGVARESQRIGIVQQDIDLHNRMESEIAEQWARGIVDNEQDQVRAARQKLAGWNTDNPELPIRINSNQILQRTKALRTSRQERFVKSAPREIRGAVREALQ